MKRKISAAAAWYWVLAVLPLLVTAAAYPFFPKIIPAHYNLAGEVDRYGSNLHAVLYKAGHHGSSTSSSEALLSAVQPQAAAISCGLDNDYGHPHQETLARLQAAGAEIYRTDTMGTITFTYENGALQASAADGPQQAAA